MHHSCAIRALVVPDVHCFDVSAGLPKLGRRRLDGSSLNVPTIPGQELAQENIEKDLDQRGEKIMTDVTVGYEGMQSAASQLQQGQEQMTEQLQSLRSMIDSLVSGEFRTHLASPRFQESYEEWNSGAQ
jgi:hypothetical protein